MNTFKPTAVITNLANLDPRDQLNTSLLQWLRDSDISVLTDEDDLTNHINIPVIKTFIDAQGLSCPQPLLKAKIALRTTGNDYVYLLATDANSVTDIQAYANHANLHVYHWREVSEANDKHTALLFHFLLANI